MKLLNHNKYTRHQVEFILSNFSSYTNKELAEELGLKPKQVRNIYRKYGLKRSKTGKFKKGQVAWNKGLRGLKLSDKGQFGKGHTPHNHKPVGSTRITKDGYLEQKVSEPNKWKSIHRIIWEQKHGAIPKGSIVVFKQGADKLNFTANDLECITRSENLKRNHNRKKFSATLRRLWHDAKEAITKGETPKTRLRVRVYTNDINSESAMFGRLIA